MTKKREQLTPGDAEFTVVDAEDCVSKQQNQMIKLQLRVCDSKGVEGTVFDYIVASAQWKIKNLLDSIGKGELYEKGALKPADLIGESGHAVIYIQKDMKGEFGDRPKVKDYFADKSPSKRAPRMSREVSGASNDIPF